MIGKTVVFEVYICTMLNLGLIGNTETLEPFVKRMRKNPGINIVGKTSVGGSAQLNSFHFSIPEFNRIELIERADLFLIDDSSLLPFHSMCDIVKKSKHIFFAGYPDLTIEECSQLVKLANESGSVIQVSNPHYFHPAIQWMNNNIVTPSFLDVTFFTAEFNPKSIFALLLMLMGITGLSPKKIGAVSFQSDHSDSNFNNVRLEFSDASVVNLNYGNLQPLSEFKIKSYAPGQFVTLSFTGKTYLCNNEAIDISAYPATSEFDTLTDTIAHKTHPISNIEDYLIVLNAVQKINKKIAQFSTQ